MYTINCNTDWDVCLLVFRCRIKRIVITSLTNLTLTPSTLTAMTTQERDCLPPVAPYRPDSMATTLLCGTSASISSNTSTLADELAAVYIVSCACDAQLLKYCECINVVYVHVHVHKSRQLRLKYGVYHPINCSRYLDTFL